MVSFPTDNKGNILDLVLANNPERVLDILDVRTLGKSDHYPGDGSCRGHCTPTRAGGDVRLEPSGYEEDEGIDGQNQLNERTWAHHSRGVLDKVQ